MRQISNSASQETYIYRFSCLGYPYQGITLGNSTNDYSNLTEILDSTDPTMRESLDEEMRSLSKRMGKPYLKPDPPQLPLYTVIDSVPFHTTGMNFTGPLYVKENGTQQNVYICLLHARGPEILIQN
jgi:hypothetical protein